MTNDDTELRSATTPGAVARRIRREQRTVETMIAMFCADHHPSESGTVGTNGDAAGLCTDCAALLDYARRKIDICPFGEGKPTCLRCTVHCYRPDMREKIRAVMRYSGPRMPLRHPYLAIRHLSDRRSG